MHAGKHEPVIDRAVFEAVQARLHAAAVTHKARRRNTSFLLAGCVYDDRGHRMTPSHANKLGVRYRYYVSQAVLQNRKAEAGTIARVAAPDIEALVAASVRRVLHNPEGQEHGSTTAEPSIGDALPGQDRVLIAAHVERVVVGAVQVEITLRNSSAGDTDTGTPSSLLTVRWSPRMAWVRKGISHEPSGAQGLDPNTRDTLLAAIGRARSWIRDLMEGQASSFAEIAQRVGKAEQHIRLLASLAFVSPRIVAAIIDGSAPAGLTVSALARSLPHLWSDQEQQFRID